MEFTLKKGNMNLKNHRRQVLISLWWLLEACILYYCDNYFIIDIFFMHATSV